MTQQTARITLERPWLELALGAPMRVLSWSINRPGYATATRILWREVRDADLTPDLDVPRWLDRELTARGAGDAVTLLTSRDVGTYSTARAVVEGAEALAVATVGLSNAEAVGRRLTPPAPAGHGTINIALRLVPGPGEGLSQGLSDGALAEAMSIAVQARTAAVLAAGVHLPGGGLASGTGTDCVAVAAHPGGIGYAGLHTPLGEAVGRAVTDAMTEGLARWLSHEGHRLPVGSVRLKGDAQ